MNLLYPKVVKQQYVNKILTDEIKFHNFREFEYSRLEYYIRQFLDYIKNNTSSKFEFEYSLEIEDDTTNVYLDYTEAYICKIPYKYKFNDMVKEDTLTFRIPKLVDRHYFYIYGNMYVPIIKLKDRAVYFTEDNLILRAGHMLFTMTYRNHKKNKDFTDLGVKIYTRRKIELHEFFYYMYKDSDPDFLKELSKFYEYDFTKRPSTRSYRDFVGHISVFEDENDTLDDILTKVVFSDYAKRLFEYELGFKPKSVGEIVKYIFKNFIFYDQYPVKPLVTLKNRRFYFMEYLIMPLYYSLYSTLVNISTSIKSSFTMNKDKLLSVFVAGDPNLRTNPGKYLYDYGSVYSGVLANISIHMEGTVRKTLKSIHTTYKNIICPIATSSSEPGVQIHINPETKLSEFGHIVDRFVTVEQYKQELSNNIKK